MAKKQETLTLFPEVLVATRKLTNEQFGILMRAAFEYRFNGTEYSSDDPAIDTAYQFVASQIDRYRDICDTKAKAAKDRWDARRAEEIDAKGTDGCTSMQKVQMDAPIQSSPIQSSPIQSSPDLSDNKERKADKPPSRHRFIPPTVEEVRAYCAEKGYNVDPQRFVDFYTSNGWRVGKNPMKDWKASVRTWERNEKGKPARKGGNVFYEIAKEEGIV